MQTLNHELIDELFLNICLTMYKDLSIDSQIFCRAPLKIVFLLDYGVAALSAMLVNCLCQLRFSKASRLALEQKY